MAHRIIKFAVRLLIALALAAALSVAPLPHGTPAMVFNVQIPLIVFLVVSYTGKLMIDTFFYDRHP